MKTAIPKTVGVAVQLLILATILFILFMVAHLTSIVMLEQSAITHVRKILLCDTVIYIIVIIVSLAGILQGRRWARLLYVGYIGIRFAVLYSLHGFSSTNGLINLLVISYWLIITIGITLLFSPESNSYFNGKQQPPLSKNTQRPRIITLAVGLQLVNLVVFVAGEVAAVFYYRSISQPLWYFSINSTLSSITDTTIQLLIMAVLLTAIYRQKAWARTVLTIYAIYRLLFHFYTIHYMTYPTSVELLVYLFHILNFSSLTMLYFPSSNFWFTHVKKSKPSSRSNHLP